MSPKGIPKNPKPKAVPSIGSFGQGFERPEKYATCTTDFDQVALFNQLFANLVERSRNTGIPEILDYLLSEGGVEMDNDQLMNRLNKLGMRTELKTPLADEDKKAKE